MLTSHQKATRAIIICDDMKNQDNLCVFEAATSRWAWLCYQSSTLINCHQLLQENSSESLSHPFRVNKLRLILLPDKISNCSAEPGECSHRTRTKNPEKWKMQVSGVGGSFHITTTDFHHPLSANLKSLIFLQHSFLKTRNEWECWLVTHRDDMAPRVLEYLWLVWTHFFELASCTVVCTGWNWTHAQ